MGKRRTEHVFAQVPSATIPRSMFNRSFTLKTTFDAGLLIPIYVDEMLPGDSFKVKMTGFGRLATPLHPFMDNLYLDTFFFAVPNRLLWSNWKRFMGEQVNPGDSTDYLVPQMPSPAGGWTTGSLGDYFGLPTGVDIETSALPFRAYVQIYNEWFRDQNLINSVGKILDDGPDNPANVEVRRRGKRHDYFTSALPWPQKGEAVLLPLGDKAPVRGMGGSDQTYGAGAQANIYESGGNLTSYAANDSRSAAAAWYIQQDPDNPGYPNVYADLTEATASTINELRQAFQLQKLFERDARGGSRLTEIIRSHFGVVSPDQRLQRPEYLGGGTSRININPVAQTSETSETSPQANLAAIGTSVVSGHGFTYSATEHVTLIGLACIRADLTYQQGIDRMWSRNTRYDFYWPSLSHLGEQSVLNREIYAQGTDEDDDVFGYQERYAEYRYKPSKICGKFRSTDPQTLDSWHLAQHFTSLPTLSQTFIEENPPVDRVIAVQDEPHLIFDAFFDMRCARPMPVYAVPGLIDHF